MSKWMHQAFQMTSSGLKNASRANTKKLASQHEFQQSHLAKHQKNSEKNKIRQAMKSIRILQKACKSAAKDMMTCR